MMAYRLTEGGPCRLREFVGTTSTVRNSNSQIRFGEFVALAATWEFRCAYCRQEKRHLVVEHIVPLSRGGEDVAENIVPACFSCNCSKKNHLLLEWAMLPTPWPIREA